MTGCEYEQMIQRLVVDAYLFTVQISGEKKRAGQCHATADNLKDRLEQVMLEGLQFHSFVDGDEN